jgi:hypothetical protein
VAMMVVLLEATGERFSVGPDQLCALAQLGVSSLALVRDERTVGIVLDGWLFDPNRSATAAVDGLASGGRALHPVMHVSLPRE